ncbi:MULTISPECIES: flagellar biosynthesis protein [unclassified Pseudomonas]|uniref:flagellar biosynthesis protein n=1 Tax=unclassified Pseudomonas TaxID=196821 RepID=UPI002449EFB3|nr:MULTISPECIES: flagellar biosynthesis protein [unclassified Pseudomonas]MDH0302903.1 flagellar biosynthesis protein [Pseudomonas sp. GD04091]MDH1985492.1 flagellar biosynthesis protein [Pseudomonas sp. GD03689]
MTYFKATAAAIAFASLVGCATNRSEVDVSGPAPQAAAPGQGQQVYISAVDERVFQINPRSADIPSLKNDEIHDTRITERAIGRKRNGFGKGLGDVVLPSGRTVSQLVGNAVAAAYQQAGYQVVSTPSPSAAAVNVHIIEYWSWFSPGAFTVAVNNKARLKIEHPDAAPLEIVTSARDSMQMATDSDWKTINEQGLNAIVTETGKQLGKARP